MFDHDQSPGLELRFVVSRLGLLLGLLGCSAPNEGTQGVNGTNTAVGAGGSPSVGGAAGLEGTLTLGGASGSGGVAVGGGGSLGTNTTDAGGATGSPSTASGGTGTASEGFGGSTSAGNTSAGSTDGVASGGGGATQSTTTTDGTGGTASVPLDPSLLDQCSGSDPVTCSISVPDGNYTVTVELGDPADTSTSRVQAELFRISVPEVTLAQGALSQHTFAVNVRAEQHDGYSAPGKILDLLIDGPMPRLNGLGVAAAPTSITVFVAGDSTVCDWDPTASNISSPDQRGWAQALSQYFTPNVAVANYADSGETAGSFYGKFWPGSEPIKAGDYVLIQFGHNDQKNQSDIDNYKTNLMRYVDDARNKSATPILLTPVARKAASTENPGFAGLDEQVRELANDEDVDLIDLTLLSLDLYQQQPDLNVFFANGGADGTHLSETGAIAVANLVAQALKNGPLPLAQHVR